MSRCRWFGTFLVLGGLAALVGSRVSLYAQEKETKLELKAFDPDVNKVFYQTMNTKTEQDLTVMNMTVNQKQEQTFYLKWTPQKKDDKGNWVVKETIVGIKMDIDIGGNKISFDSTADNQPQNPLTDFFKALLNVDLTFTIDPKKPEVIKIDGNNELITNLGKANPQMEPLLKSILSKEALTKMVEPVLFVIPSSGVKHDGKKGTTWTRKTTLELGPIGDYAQEYTYTYLGKDDKDKGLEKIGVGVSLTYAPPKDAKGKLPFNIEGDSKLASDSGSGFIFFNPKLGRIEKSSIDVNLKGDLNVDIGGMKTSVKLSQKQNATVITSDADPVAELKKKK